MIEWEKSIISGGLDCAGCREAYEAEGEEPPCHECGKPARHPANELAWNIWRVCSTHERPPAMGGLSPIRATAVSALVKDFGGDERDFWKILRIERELYPVICQNLKKGK
jgi:hypothetical protein